MYKIYVMDFLLKKQSLQVQDHLWSGGNVTLFTVAVYDEKIKG